MYVIINQVYRTAIVSPANVTYRDMVRIDPPDLRPRDLANQNAIVQIKKIDKALALELPVDRVDRAFIKWPAAYRTFVQSIMNSTAEAQSLSVSKWRPPTELILLDNSAFGLPQVSKIA